MNKNDDKEFWEFMVILVLFLFMLGGAFWVQEKYSNAYPYLETDIRE